MRRKHKPIDYQFKADVMRVNLHQKIKRIDSYDFREHQLLIDDGIVPQRKYDDEFVDLQMQYGSKWIKEARKINLASYKRVERLKDRIASYLSLGQCIFVTLTFNDETMQKYNEKQRRTLVSRYLKRCSDKYVANIDYGNDDKYSHREHYHALVLSDYISDKWDGGFSWFEKVHRIDSEKCLAKYISKLCNHAIKDSTKRACYIYSR